MKALPVSKGGETYEEEALRKDLYTLWKTGRFEDVQVKTEAGMHGGIAVRFIVIERQ